MLALFALLQVLQLFSRVAIKFRRWEKDQNGNFRNNMTKNEIKIKKISVSKSVKILVNQSLYREK